MQHGGQAAAAHSLKTKALPILITVMKKMKCNRVGQWFSARVPWVQHIWIAPVAS